jgi:hypothetical protein
MDSGFPSSLEPELVGSSPAMEYVSSRKIVVKNKKGILSDFRANQIRFT